MKRVAVLSLSLVLALSGCAPQGVDDAAAAPAVKTAVSAPAASAAASRMALAADAGQVAFGDASRARRQSGQYHWEPVVFSEAHALNAVRNGQLLVPLPGGTVLPVRAVRHAEHEDGNWTFVGKTHDGGDAVITFGPDAVFGSIQGPRGTVRLVTDRRGGWVVTGPRGSDLEPTRPDGTDTLLPPELPHLNAQSARLAFNGPGWAKAIGEAQEADGVVVVDVVVGFTAGLAQARGGESAARTRVTNLVEVTNQAYANSGLPARLRLAHAMQVEFGDATGNSDALSKLTGYKAGSGPVAIDPALQPLRSAREAYYGDLVVLLRSFRSPENDGCGIAWLLGGGRSSIDASDAPFGYTVVADGSDFDESDSKTYFCREETFAHELGHLMGQAHNTEDASTAGAHAYSYGYRQSFAGGFYTVMAYRLPDGGQFPIRHFANPQVNFNGSPTGTPDASDNVRSLIQTLPLIAAFRVAPQAPPPPTVPVARRVVNDLDGDGLSDMVWQGPGTGYFETWRMEGQRLARALGFQLPAGNRVVTAGDFNGDRRLDLIVQDASNALFLYEGNGTTFAALPIGRSILAGWRAIGSADVDGDGSNDLLWLHPDVPRFELWLMQGAVVKGMRSHAMAADTRVATTGDFSGDGKADVLVMNAAREVTLWHGDGLQFGAQRLSITNPVAPGWVVWGDVDMNADGRADLLWSTPAVSYFEWWNMLGATVQRASGATPPEDQRVAGTGDFNGDGMADVLLKGLGNDLHVGISDGVLFNRTPLGIVAGPGWMPLAPGKP